MGTCTITPAQSGIATCAGDSSHGSRVTVVRDVRRVPGYRASSDCITDATVAARVVLSFQQRGEIPAEREAFVVLLLDGKHRLLGLHVASIGTASSAPVHPREVFRPAVVLGASAVIVAHNHPSGDPMPSIDDRNVTERLRKAGEVLGITVLDHVVIGDGACFSFTGGEVLRIGGGA